MDELTFLPGDVLTAVREFTAQPLAIEPTWLDRLQLAVANPHPVSNAAQAALAAVRPPVRSQGGTAVLRMYGPIQPRADIFTMIFGGCPLDQFMPAFRAAVSDDTVKSIVFDCDSPGGNVAGIAEAAAEIFAARGVKPMTAVVNPQCSSAAYYLASQCDEIVASPSSLLGSIGVYLLHVDYSKSLELAGITPTYIYAGDHKVDGNPYEPLSEAARIDRQSKVDTWYGEFVDAVARGRGVTAAVVKAQFGGGREMLPAEAVKAGLADRVATFAAVLERHGGAATAQGRARAEGDDTPPEITTPAGDGGDQEQQKPDARALHTLMRRR